MNEKRKGLFFGIIVILFGISLLLNNFNLLPNADDFIGGMIFLFMGVIFYQLMRSKPENWWAGIPSIFLFFMGISLILKNFYWFPDEIMGVIFLWSCAVAFGFIYHKYKTHWWPVIPAGACITLGTVVLVEIMHLVPNDTMNGVILFLGFGLTFLYLYYLKPNEKKLDWAIYPAVGCFLMTVIVYIEASDWARSDLIFPLLLVAIGVFILLRSGKRPE